MSRSLTVAAAAMLALLGTVMLGLSQEGAGKGSLPRVQDVAGGFIDPLTETPAFTAGTAASVTPDASATASPAASASPVASSLEEPVLPAIPPPDDDTQTPVQSQYTGGN
jgi:hypothetical protein